MKSIHSNYGLMPVPFVQMNFPYKALDPRQHEYVRYAGNRKMTVFSPNGVPYGVIPRRLLCWITTNAVKQNKQTLYLGDTLNAFLQDLQLGRGGGPRGDINRLKRQMKILLTCFVTIQQSDKVQSLDGTRQVLGKFEATNITFFKSGQFLWKTAPYWRYDTILPKNERGCVMELSDDFFAEIKKENVPVDLELFEVFADSPMAIDMAIWLSYRLSTIQNPLHLSWESLSCQLGANYSRIWDFKRRFRYNLFDLTEWYGDIRYDMEDKEFVLYPGSPLWNCE